MFANAHHFQIHNGTFIAANYAGNGPNILETLMKVSSPSAFHNFVGQPDPSRCYPNTRVGILDGLVRWIQGQEAADHPIKWLHGGAGAGKSAVARTLAERCESLGYIVASFFFFRPDNTRNHAGPLIPTLAYQVARGYPGVHSHIETIIQDDPHIFNQDLRRQFSSLIIDPMLKARRAVHSLKQVPPCVIIIDGLDECAAGEMQAGIVGAIGEALRDNILQVPLYSLPRFLVCSRPEDAITRAFRSQGMTDMYTELNLSIDQRASQDIRVFLFAQFDAIKETHRRKDLIPPHWPTYKDVNFLQFKSSGQFIYAKVAMRFISNHVRPMTALKVILGLEISPQNSCQPFAELDTLFLHILRRALNNTSIDTVRDILGFLALSGELVADYHQDVLEMFLRLTEGSLDTFLIDIASLISVKAANMGPSFLHKSFHDFLHDSFRAAEFFVDAAVTQALIWTRRCQLISDRWSANQEQIERDQLYLFIDRSFSTFEYMRTPAWTPELHSAMNNTPIKSIWRFWVEYHPFPNNPKSRVTSLGQELPMQVYILRVMMMMLEANSDHSLHASRQLLVAAVADLLEILTELIDKYPAAYAAFGGRRYNATVMPRDSAWSVICDVLGRSQYQPHPRAVRYVLDLLTRRTFSTLSTYAFLDPEFMIHWRLG